MRHRKDTLLIHIQLSPESHFTNDLGLDSLDTVEVVMAIEEVGHNL
jgi:acyl carrier protein